MTVKPLHEYTNINPMDTALAEIFLSMQMQDMKDNTAYLVNDIEAPLAELFGVSVPFPMKVFLAHLGTHSPDTSLTLGAAAFITFNLDSPGTAVMWAYTVHRLAQRNDFQRAVTVAVLANAFPQGFPSNETLEQAWDAQKGSNNIGGNLLDDPETWK